MVKNLPEMKLDTEIKHQSQSVLVNQMFQFLIKNKPPSLCIFGIKIYKIKKLDIDRFPNWIRVYRPTPFMNFSYMIEGCLMTYIAQ